MIRLRELILHRSGLSTLCIFRSWIISDGVLFDSLSDHWLLTFVSYKLVCLKTCKAKAKCNTKDDGWCPSGELIADAANTECAAATCAKTDQAACCKAPHLGDAQGYSKLFGGWGLGAKPRLHLCSSKTARSFDG